MIIFKGDVMTAQIRDSFRLKGTKYSIIALSKPIKFNPTDYGITPESRSTACWKGYWCDYDISEDGIMLTNLYINSKDAYYPNIHGIKVSQNEGDTKKAFLKYMGHHLYENLNIPMNYSGKIVIGDKFIRDYYIHMGYQKAWAYKVVLELIFMDGKLITTYNHNELVANMRQTIDKDPDIISKKLYEDIKSFVEKSFSLEFKDKVWWFNS